MLEVVKLSHFSHHPQHLMDASDDKGGSKSNANIDHLNSQSDGQSTDNAQISSQQSQHTQVSQHSDHHDKIMNPTDEVNK